MLVKIPGSRTNKYLHVALGRHSRPERNKFINEIFATIVRLELQFPNLAQQIEEKLGDRPSFKGSEEKKLFRLAINSVVGNDLKPPKWGRLGTFVDHLTDPSLCDPAEIAEVSEQQEWKRRASLAIQREVEALPERDKKIVRAVYVEGKSQAEAARELGISTSTLNDAIHKAIKTLAVRLRDFQVKGTDG